MPKKMTRCKGCTHNRGFPKLGYANCALLQGSSGEEMHEVRESVSDIRFSQCAYRQWLEYDLTPPHELLALAQQARESGKPLYQPGWLELQSAASTVA